MGSHALDHEPQLAESPSSTSTPLGDESAVSPERNDSVGPEATRNDSPSSIPEDRNDDADDTAIDHEHVNADSSDDLLLFRPEIAQDEARTPVATQLPMLPILPAEEQELEVDEIDSDSAIGSDSESATTSLSESIWNYRNEHGRTYHAYKDGKYIFPNDEREADRLDLQHHLFDMTFGNRLFLSPLSNPKRCIDIGTGTGIWALDFADLFPDCDVMGIDLSPGQPEMVPPNLKFIIDDAEDPWVYDQPFDFVHARLMAGCFADWPGFFQQAFDNLEPGGWLEVQDYGLPVRSADGTADGTDLMRWGELLCEASSKLGRPLGSDCSDYHRQWMYDAGFVDVDTKMFMWPTNTWPKDPQMKELGRWNTFNIMEGLEGFCLALLTRGLGWKKEEVDIFVAKVGSDLRDRRIHAYFQMPVVYGRKPRTDDR